MRQKPVFPRFRDTASTEICPSLLLAAFRSLAVQKPKSDNTNVSVWPTYLKRKGLPKMRHTEIGALPYPPDRTKTTSWCDLSQTPNCKVLPQTVQKRGFFTR
jgi:hypothetical protein